MEIGTKVRHKNHLEWGIGEVTAKAKNHKKVFVLFNIHPFPERPCTISNLEMVA